MSDTNILLTPEQGNMSLSHILSSCPLAAAGLAELAGGTVCHFPLWLPGQGVSQLLDKSSDIRMVVVFIPNEPFWLLESLRHLAALLNAVEAPIPVLLLSHCSALWLWQTLSKLVKNTEHLSAVYSTSAGLPCHQLAPLLRGNLWRCSPLATQAEEEELVLGIHSDGLTPKELDTILGMLSGMSVRQHAQVRNLSVKTLYNQRRAAMKKIAEQTPLLTKSFSGILPGFMHTEVSFPLSTFEREFVHAIHSGQVFAVYQPVVDNCMCLKGFEILLRWYRDGRQLHPAEFLPSIKADYAWLLLTAFVLRDAIEQVNNRNDDCYFSINIPSEIMDNDNLGRMMAVGRKQLKYPHQVNRIALEIAETTVLTRHAKSVSLVARLKELGFRVMLDDCFSQGSVMFPVRTFRFSDYKLDLSVVNDIQDDEHARALIKSLVYYCRLSGSRCTAEGVDSIEKYNILKDMGVGYFQGFLISPPVTEDKLRTLIGKIVL